MRADRDPLAFDDAAMSEMSERAPGLVVRDPAGGNGGPPAADERLRAF